MRFSATALAAIALAVISPAIAQDSKPADSSGAGYLIETLDTAVQFSADGTHTRQQTAQIRLQSDAAVRAFGVLSFPFASDTERLEIDYVRVHKPDGRVVETPASAVQEAPSPVTMTAPMYSDVRITQIPVRSLANGDLLEYRLRSIGTRPLTPNQFWFQLDFEKNAEVKSETLTIRVPVEKYVKLSSPGSEPVVHSENGEKIYSWATSYSGAKNTKATATQPERHSVELTTFRTWEEVGRWYSSLAAGKAAVTPEIQAKADELAKGLTSLDAKERAIYDYVSTKFRYISISFGEGRYQPHSAPEVMANLYGDCKDKQTLLTALMEAAGVNVSTVLIGSGLPFNPDVPSPAQFNHVIGQIEGMTEVWLDTTAEVAPFGQIIRGLRGHAALLIPRSGDPKIVLTPQAPALADSETIHFEGSLDGDGTLTGHFDFTVTGDPELLARALYHATLPSRWTQLSQGMSQAIGYTGTVSAPDIDPPQDTSKRFHFGWDYKREKYADWASLRIPSPLPGILLKLPDDPGTPLAVGNHYNQSDGEMKIPAGYSVNILPTREVSNAVGELDESYKVTEGVFKWRKVIVLHKDQILASDRADYTTLMDSANASAGRMIVLTKTRTGAMEVPKDNPQAAELIRQSSDALQAKQPRQAEDTLKHAEGLNPKQHGLWLGYASFYTASGQTQKAIESVRREIENYPEEPRPYQTLARLESSQHHPAETKAALRRYLELAAEDAPAYAQLANLLSSDKAWADAIEVLNRGIAMAPDNQQLATMRVTTLLISGSKQEGVEAARQIQQRIATNAAALRGIGYQLIDTGADPALGTEMAEKSVEILEDQLKDVQLPNLKPGSLGQMNLLGLAWDAAGWGNFLSGGDIHRAESQIQAAWKFDQQPVSADHLGRIYEKLGRKEDAIHMYRLAMDKGYTSSGIEQRRNALEGSSPTPKKGAAVTPAEELQYMRTVDLPGLPQATGEAELFVLLSAKGPQDVRFLSGPDELRAEKDAILHAKFDALLPDDGPEKIARRGILSCSQNAKPNCRLVLLLPSNTPSP